MRPLPYCLVLTAFVTASVLADTVMTATVIKVADGDTLTVLDEQHVQHKVRVSGIDAPEKAQAFGNKSKQNLADLTFQREVEIITAKKDRYGRLIGKVLVADDGCDSPNCPKRNDVGLIQVQQGLAWHYKHYEKDQVPSDRVAYAEAEEHARTQRFGLWQDKHPIPPWEWRHPRQESSANSDSR